MMTGDPGVIGARWNLAVLIGGLVAVSVVAVSVVAATGATGAASASVAADNQPPQADAGLDRDVVVDETVFLDATGSFDPDGELARFDWRIERPDGAYTSPGCETCERTQFVPGQAGRYNVTVSVEDDDGVERSDTLWVDVAVSRGPAVSLSGAERVTEGRSVDVTASASAGDADLSRVRWYQNGSYVASGTLAGETGTPVLGRTFDEPGPTTIRAEVVDRVGRTQSARHTVEVAPANRPPTAIAPGDREAERGESLSVVGDATDPDDDPSDLSYSWSSDEFDVVDQSGSDVTLRAPTSGDGSGSPFDADVTLTVTDGDLSDSDSFTVTVLPGEGSSQSGDDDGGSTGGDLSSDNGPVTYKDLGDNQADHYEQGWCTMGRANDDCDDDYTTEEVGGETYAILVDQDGDRELHFQGIDDGIQELQIGVIPENSRVAQIAIPMDDFREKRSSAFLAEYGNGSFDPIEQTERNQQPSAGTYN